MNEKDLRLVSYLQQELGNPMGAGPILLDVRTTQFVRMNLVLLKAMAGSEGANGIFVSVDRPHQYMVHLLTMHNIDHSNLIFIDAISRFSADHREVNAKVGFLEGPYNIDSLPEAVQDWTSNGFDKGIDIKKCTFAMIDNLSSLLLYNNYASVEQFIKNFVQVFGVNGNMTIPLMIDRNRNYALYEMARPLCQRELVIPEEIPRTIDAGHHMTIKNVSSDL